MNNFNGDFRVILHKDPEQLICETLANSFYPLKIKDDYLEFIKTVMEPSCLRP
jgi:hypothetical protein